MTITMTTILEMAITDVVLRNQPERAAANLKAAFQEFTGSGDTGAGIELCRELGTSKDGLGCKSPNRSRTRRLWSNA